MNVPEMVNKLDSIDINEIEKERDLFLSAKENGIVIVFGCSDDLMEFRGAIYDEAGGYGGVTVSLTQDGIFEIPSCFECEECKYLKEAQKRAVQITSIWNDLDGEYLWTFKTDIPHEKFDVLDEGEKFCRGIVFYVEDLKKEQE